MENDIFGKTALHRKPVKARPEFHRSASTYKYTCKIYENV